MNLFLLFILAFLVPSSLLLGIQASHSHRTRTFTQITVMGLVYCDTCSNNSFSKHSYFLSGVEVRISCKFKAETPRTAEQIAFSVNRTTNKYGVYRLEIPSVDGIRCAEDSAIASFCQASLIGSPSSSCNVPGYRTTSEEISIKSREANICIYSLNPLNYRPSARDDTLCGN
ncbi:pollen-specific protein-like At4g18596 [Cucurbita maxima]|uniref:Pollen-specific protein-like At4g18596 n=1 Tax=Cucurbita maxima TaxID=3661 RepID=A0A6J1JGM9_CUCMA|nr:pollen-specific protein-like At4g18596 [Cucurbita maxima]